MKTWLIIHLLGILVSVKIYASSFKSPDILIDSKLNYDWSEVLFTKYRQFLKNYNLSDPFSVRFEEPIVVNESKLNELLPDSSKKFTKNLGRSLGLNFLNSETKVTMYDFSYDLKEFKTNLHSSEPISDGLIIAADFSASELNLHAERLNFSLVIPGNLGSPLVTINILKPEIRIKNEKLINFFTKLKIEDNGESFKIKLLKANFDKMAEGFFEHPEDIEIEYQDITIPKLALRIGEETVQFYPDKIKDLIRKNHEAIKGLLLAEAANILRTYTEESAMKIIEQFSLLKEHWIATSVLQSQFVIKNFSSSKIGDNIEIDMPGDFCTNQKYDEFKDLCTSSKDTQISPSRITRKNHENSLKVLKDLMKREDANIVASISEDYINKLLVTTYDAGLWKDALDEAGVTLGPNKVKMKLDTRGESGTLMMDVIYKPTAMERIMTGSREVRFPLVLAVALRIENHDNEPVVIIRLNGVDVSDKTLIYGRPDENIVSTVRDIPRFKKSVAKAIREKVIVLSGKDIIELRYPELKGLGLDKVDFLSDGLGRMNAIMRLEDLMGDVNNN